MWGYQKSGKKFKFWSRKNFADNVRKKGNRPLPPINAQGPPIFGAATRDPRQPIPLGNNPKHTFSGDVDSSGRDDDGWKVKSGCCIPKVPPAQLVNLRRAAISDGKSWGSCNYHIAPHLTSPHPQTLTWMIIIMFSSSYEMDHLLYDNTWNTVFISDRGSTIVSSAF